MKTPNWIKGLALACAALTATCPARAEPVRIFAAASLQGPLDAVADLWGGGDVIISYGGSGTMARQISRGAPADAVILANTAWAVWLVDEGDVSATPRPLLSNRLVIVGPATAQPLPDATPRALLDRLNGGRLAMGQHMSVPAGIYAHDWLVATGAWDTVRPHLAETENVRAALALVARGETPLGIVYASDAAASDAVSIVYNIPQDDHAPIQYPGIALTADGDAFLTHVAEQAEIFVAAGFGRP